MLNASLCGSYMTEGNSCCVIPVTDEASIAPYLVYLPIDGSTCPLNRFRVHNHTLNSDTTSVAE